jgi:hypothetical protein
LVDDGSTETMVVGDFAAFIQLKIRVLESEFELASLGLFDRRRQQNQTTRNMAITPTPRMTPMTAPSHVGILLPPPELEGTRLADGVDVALARE